MGLHSPYSLLNLKISVSLKLSHFKFFGKLWTFLLSSYCRILISPQLSGSVMCKWDTVPWLKLCRIEGLFHMFWFRSMKTPFYGVCLAHNSTALLTHIWLPIHPNTCTISAVLPSCSISLLYLWGCLALFYTPASLFIEPVSSNYPGWGFFGILPSCFYFHPIPTLYVVAVPPSCMLWVCTYVFSSSMLIINCKSVI